MEEHGPLKPNGCSMSCAGHIHSHSPFHLMWPLGCSASTRIFRSCTQAQCLLLSQIVVPTSVDGASGLAIISASWLYENGAGHYSCEPACTICRCWWCWCSCHKYHSFCPCWTNCLSMKVLNMLSIVLYMLSVSSVCRKIWTCVALKICQYQPQACPYMCRLENLLISVISVPGHVSPWNFNKILMVLFVVFIQVTMLWQNLCCTSSLVSNDVPIVLL